MAQQQMFAIPNGLVGEKVSDAQTAVKNVSNTLKLGVAASVNSTTFSPIGDSAGATVTAYANSTPGGGEIAENGTVGVVINPPQNSGG